MTKVLPLTAALFASTVFSVSAPTSAAAAAAQMRTYVSGQGSDSNACTATAPCASFQAALALTLAGGEIFVLNSANFGAVTINKAVTITSEGSSAGVLATSGVGITINAGTNDVVNLRGLSIDGGTTGTVGIQFNSGQALNIQKSVVRGFANSGISFTPAAAASLFVSDTTLTNNKNNGILVSAGSGVALKAAISRVTASGNGVGIFANGATVSMTIADAVTSYNSYGVGVTSSAVMVRNSTAASNTVGIAADQGAVVRVGQSTVTANGTGWQATNGGQLLSYSNNNVSGNGTDGTSTTTLALQ